MNLGCVSGVLEARIQGQVVACGLRAVDVLIGVLFSTVSSPAVGVSTLTHWYSPTSFDQDPEVKQYSQQQIATHGDSVHLSKSAEELYALKEPDQIVVPARTLAARSRNDKLDEYLMVFNVLHRRAVYAPEGAGGICTPTRMMRTKSRMYHKDNGRRRITLIRPC